MKDNNQEDALMYLKRGIDIGIPKAKHIIAEQYEKGAWAFQGITTKLSRGTTWQQKTGSLHLWPQLVITLRVDCTECKMTMRPFTGTTPLQDWGT